MTRLPAFALALILVPAGAPAAVYVLSRTLANPAPAQHDFFGIAVALVDGLPLVGAYFDDAAARNAGTAYLFDGGSGSLLHTLTCPSPAAGDRFGSAVAGLPGIAIVTAPDRDSGAAHAGAVYLVDQLSGQLLRTLTAPTPTLGDKFGFAVAGGSGRLLIGAPFDSRGAESAGAAYLFDAGTGALRHTFLHPAPQSADLFGRAVAIAHSTLVVGAPLHIESSVVAGIAYQLDADSGALVHTFRSPARRPGQFGAAVATDGAVVLIGAPLDEVAGVPTAGAAYLFDADTGLLLQTFVAPVPSTDARFATAVALSGPRGFVGASMEDDGTVADVGAVHVFDTATGLLLETIRNPAPALGDHFGAAVAADSDRLLVGASQDDNPVQNAGTAYYYVDPAGPPPTTLPRPSTTTTTTTTTSTEAPSTTTSTTTTSTIEEATSTTTVEETTSTTTVEETTTTTTSDPGEGSSTTTTETAPSETTTTILEDPTSTTTEVPTTTTSTEAPATTTTASPTTIPPVTSTTPLATTTTTGAALLPVCLPEACADTDRCTADACAEGEGCVHNVPVGYATIVCRLARVTESLEAFGPGRVGGRAAYRRLDRALAKVARLLGTSPRHPRPRLQAARQALVAFVLVARRAGGTRYRLATDRLITLARAVHLEIDRLRALERR